MEAVQHEESWHDKTEGRRRCAIFTGDGDKRRVAAGGGRGVYVYHDAEPSGVWATIFSGSE